MSAGEIECPGRPPVHFSTRGGHHLGGVRAGERDQFQDGRPRVPAESDADRGSHIALPAAHRQQQHHSPTPQPPRHELDRGERVRVRPVQVLDGQNGRYIERLDQPQDRLTGGSGVGAQQARIIRFVERVRAGQQHPQRAPEHGQSGVVGPGPGGDRGHREAGQRPERGPHGRGGGRLHDGNTGPWPPSAARTCRTG